MYSRVLVPIELMACMEIIILIDVPGVAERTRPNIRTDPDSPRIVVEFWPTHSDSALLVAEDGEITEERFFYELVGLIRQIGLA